MTREEALSLCPSWAPNASIELIKLKVTLRPMSVVKKKKTRKMTGSRPASTVFQAYFPCSKLPRDNQPYVPNLEGFRLSNNAAKYSRMGKVEGKIVSRSLEIDKRKCLRQLGGIVNVCHDASAKLLED